MSSSETRPRKNPLKGWWTFLSVVAAVVLGLASLLLFLTPAEIADSFSDLRAKDFWLSLLFFVLGSLVTAERWRACLHYRASRSLSFHTMGVAHAGNLLIPGRIGEPIRVFLLAELKVAPEYGTSAVIQERVADQVLRVVFLAATVILVGVSGGQGLGSRMAAVALTTAVVLGVLTALVKSRESVAENLGHWLGRLPRVQAETVRDFVSRTLGDLSNSLKQPGGLKALFLGLLAWSLFAVHTEFILRSYFSSQTLAYALLILAIAPPTAPTQPGLFHGMALAATAMLGGGKVPALQAAIVIHLMQMGVFTVWGVVSWFALNRAILIQEQLSLATGSRSEKGQEKPPQDSPQVTPVVEHIETRSAQSEA